MHGWPYSETCDTKRHYPEMEDFIHTLDERERIIIRARLSGEKLKHIGLTLQNYNTGDMGITGSRVREIECRACYKLRRRIGNHRRNEQAKANL